MELAIASIIVVFLLSFIAFLWESRRKRQLKQKLKFKNKRLQQVTRVSNTIFHNINAFVLLIDSDFRVLSTNYFARANKKEGDGDTRRVGNLISCRNALDSGLCGTHERCQECIVCRELTKAFNTKTNFLDVEASVTMVVGRNDVNCETLISGSYVQVDGQERLVLTMKDITGFINVKRENEKLQQVVSYASSTALMGFASLNIYTSEQTMTPEYAINMGEDDSQTAESIFINFDHVHPDDRESLLIFINKAKREKTDPITKEIRILTGENSWKWTKIHLMQKTFMPESQEITFYSMNIDITEEKKKEENLINQRKKAEISDRSKSAFLANMSHEIRTPLNAILGFSELLATATGEEEKEQYLNILKSNNEMLLQLINDILDQAKIDAGVMDFAYADVDMNSLISDLEQLFKMRLGKDSKVKIYCEPSYPSCVINTDKNRVSQVLSNFISNAVKFTDAGSIRIGYKPCEKGLYFYVKDTGVGIKNEKVGDVFQRFTRFHEDKMGNGLGLSICKTIVEKLNGEIGVESVYGKGSTFWFVLPQHPTGLSTRVETRESASPEREPENNFFRNSPPPEDGKDRVTVLITEDIEESYRLYETILKHDYHLLWARGGEEALSLFLHYNPGLVFMNLVLPGVDGYSTTEAIRQISPRVPVIALIPAGYDVNQDKLNRSGFTDFITKPVAANLLLGKVEEYCQ